MNICEPTQVRAYILNHGNEHLKCLLKSQITNTHMQSQVIQHESEVYKT